MSVGEQGPHTAASDHTRGVRRFKRRIDPILGGFLLGIAPVAGEGRWWLALVMGGVAGALITVWWRWENRYDHVSALSDQLLASTFGMVSERGATVTIRPGPHPEVPGEITVDMPDQE